MADDDDPPSGDDDGDEASAVKPSDIERQLLADGAVPRKRARRESPGDREAREARTFWLAVLADPVGRRELWRLVTTSGSAHIFETMFPAGPVGFPDPNAAWYQRGIQDFGLRLYRHWLKLDPLAVAAMHQENDPAFAPAKQERR